MRDKKDKRGKEICVNMGIREERECGTWERRTWGERECLKKGMWGEKECEECRSSGKKRSWCERK